MTSELLHYGLRTSISVLADAGIKAGLMLAIASLACLALRGASAAVRHQIWCLAFCSTVALPFVESIIPQWRIPVFAARDDSDQSLPKTSNPLAGIEMQGDETVRAAVNSVIKLSDSTPMDATAVPFRELTAECAEPSACGAEVLPTQAISTLPRARASNSKDPPATGLAVPDWTTLTSDRAAAIAVLWLAGFAVVMAPFAAGAAVTRRLVRRARRMTEAQAAELVQGHARRLGLARQVIVIETGDSLAPMTTGVLRPVVVLPVDWRSWPAERLRFVLLHELAHIRRLDVLFQMIGRVACGLYWFNPLAWHALRRLRIERELACDDCVVTLGVAASAYARQLLEIARAYRSPRLAVGIAMTRSSRLEERILSVLDNARSHRPVSTSLGYGLATLAAGLVMTLSLVTLGEAGSAPTDLPAVAATGDASAAPATEDIEEHNTKDAPEQAPVAKPAPVAVPSSEKQAFVQALVVGAEGKPVAGAEIYWFRSRVHDLRPMKPKLVATTDQSGRARFANPSKGAADNDEPASWEYRESIVVKASGHGFADTSLEMSLQPKTFFGALAKAVGGPKQSTIELPAAGDPIRGRLVDIDGRPVVGATVRIRWFNEENDGIAARYASEVEGGKDAIWQPRVQSLRDVIEPEPLRHVLPMATTNADGRFELRDIGRKRLVQLVVQGDQIESAEIIACNASDDEVVVHSPRPGEKPRTVYGRNLLSAIGPSKPVEGRVVDFDTGAPISDAVVRAFTIHGDRLYTSREREEYSARTDADGRFRITGLPIGDGNSLAAFTTGDVAYIPIGQQVNTSGQGPTIHSDFRLKRGVWAEGRVFDAQTSKPFTGEITYYFFQNRELENLLPGLRKAFVDGCYWTNAKGEFRVPVLPSRGILAFRYEGIPFADDQMSRYPQGQGADDIEGAEDRGWRSFPTFPSYLIASNYHRVAEVRPVDGEATVRVGMPLQASKPISISVVDAQGKPVTGFEAYGAAANWGWQPKENSIFEVGDLRPNEQRKIFVFHRARNLAGAVIVGHQAQQNFQVELKAAGSISGRLVDRDGEPIIDASLFTNYEKLGKQEDAAIWANHPKLRANPTTIPVDNEGRFIVDGLIPGWNYSAHASAPRKVQGEVMNYGIGSPFENVSIEPGEKKDLGDIVLNHDE